MLFKGVQNMNEQGGVAILLHPLWVGRKIAQIGQTESRRRTLVRREAKFVRNAKHFLFGNWFIYQFLLSFFLYFTAFDPLKMFALSLSYALRGLRLLLQPLCHIYDSLSIY